MARIIFLRARTVNAQNFLIVSFGFKGLTAGLPAVVGGGAGAVAREVCCTKERERLMIYRGVQHTCTFPSKMEPITCRRLLELLSCRSGKLMVQVFKLQKKCDLNQFFAAAGTNYLPQVHNNRAISDLNFPLAFEFWNLPLPKVQSGSNFQSQRICVLKSCESNLEWILT
jgi:hypothetical protein